MSQESVNIVLNSPKGKSPSAKKRAKHPLESLTGSLKGLDCLDGIAYHKAKEDLPLDEQPTFPQQGKKWLADARGNPMSPFFVCWLHHGATTVFTDWTSKRVEQVKQTCLDFIARFNFHPNLFHWTGDVMDFFNEAGCVIVNEDGIDED